MANAPYVPTDGVGLMPPEARLHTPMAALDGGADGLDLLRRGAGLARTAWAAARGIQRRQAGSLAVDVAASGLTPWRGEPSGTRRHGGRRRTASGALRSALRCGHLRSCRKAPRRSQT
ncbi:hypothetical protein Voc01_103550 [Virgisporangium ochraceum]|uniref:Uncharacterized protein n=1 Tax=Virgisporangium ochraceum TaxID=65505 RepID=A0A8J4A5T3_9ACTN|nr:hypothetical protein Voc01_103550 [Virgisporangium ochraceum]